MSFAVRVILVASVLTAQFICGWMRQCCAAGCAAHRSGTLCPSLGVRAVPGEGDGGGGSCCRRCRHEEPAAPEPRPQPQPQPQPKPPGPCCPFGKRCGDEADRSRGNPPSPGEHRAACDDLPLPVAVADVISAETVPGVLRPEPGRALLATLPPLALTSRLRN
jgi:hypothetical protein